MDEIVAAADISKGLIFHYFGTRKSCTSISMNLSTALSMTASSSPSSRKTCLSASANRSGSNWLWSTNTLMCWTFSSRSAGKPTNPCERNFPELKWRAFRRGRKPFSRGLTHPNCGKASIWRK
ncbi:TetR family transcriptional regulator [Desulfitobacterium hafniense]|nr:TetR family transcriptional regulator [Desulfitobacterium hafniense]